MLVSRLLLAILAAQGLFIGLPAATTPRWFYDTFPFGTQWLRLIGPYSEHFVVDTGSLYLGIAAATIYASVRPTADRVRVAAIANIVGSFPHAVYHTICRHSAGLLATVVIAGTLWLTAMVSVVLFLLVRGRDRAAS